MCLHFAILSAMWGHCWSPDSLCLWLFPDPGICLSGVCSTGPLYRWILAPSPDLTWFCSLFLLQHAGLSSPQTPQLPLPWYLCTGCFQLFPSLTPSLPLSETWPHWPTGVVRFPPRLAIPVRCGLVIVCVALCSRLSCPLDWTPGGVGTGSFLFGVVSPGLSIISVT